MRDWLNQHRQALQQVLARMWKARLATLMMCSVMGVTLCLPGILYVIVDNLNRLAGDVQNEPKISLFLKLDTTPEAIKELEKRLSANPAIKSYRFVSKDSAWQELRQNTGLGDVTGGLEQNPLPDAYFVQSNESEPAAVDSLLRQMQQWPGVEHALVDANWVKRLYALLALGNKAILVLAGLLGFALLAIIGNTIRLQILTQREEIEVSKLIGATDRFIRRPFLYAGTLYGLGGGLTAWLMLASVIWLFNLSVAELAELYASSFRLGMPDTPAMLAIIGGAVGLGWLGAYWAVNRSLSQLEIA